MATTDFVYMPESSMVIIVARTPRATERIKQEEKVEQRMGPAYRFDPQEALVVRHVLMREGYIVTTL